MAQLQRPAVDPAVVTPPGGSRIPVASGAPGGTVLSAQLPEAEIAEVGGKPYLHGGEQPKLTISHGWKLPANTRAQFLEGCPEDMIGSTLVELPGAPVKAFRVNDLCVPGPDGKPMLLIIPTLDKGKMMFDADGKKIGPAALLDAHIRKITGAGPNDKIAMLGAFVHLEGFSIKSLGELSNVAKGKLKTEGGYTHVTMYRGDALTTNAPDGYHGGTMAMFDDGRVYACQLYIIRIDGVDDVTFMKNMSMVDDQIGRHPRFPRHANGYKQDPMATFDFNSQLMFYADWLRKKPYVTEMEWQNYCAENKFNVATIAANVPQNEAAFVEIFGAVEGKELWALAKADFKLNNGRDMTAADETHFMPLWKKLGYKPEQIRKWPDPATRQAYLDAKYGGTLASYTGFVPMEPGAALIATPETTADLLANVIEAYVPFAKAGAYHQIAAMLGFKAPAESRIELKGDAVMGAMQPVLAKMLIAEAMATAPGKTKDEWLKAAKEQLLAAVFAAKADEATPPPTDAAALQQYQAEIAKKKAELEAQLAPLFAGVATKLDGICASPVRGAEAQRSQAAKWLRKEVRKDFDAARKLGIAKGSQTAVEWNTPPGMFARMVAGLHPTNPGVSIEGVALAFPAEYLERTDGKPSVA